MAENGAVKAAMKATTPPDPKNVAENPVFDPAEFSRLTGRNMEAATRLARAYFNGATKFNQELIGFVNGRMRKDFESAQAIMTAKNSEEALQAQADFLECAFRDYADEASKMLNVAADIAKDSLKSSDQ